MARQAAKPKSEDGAVLSVRLDTKLKRRLDRLARASDRTNSWLVQDAIAAYLDTQEWQVEAIGEAVKSADAHPERTIPHDRVKAWALSLGSKRELRRPK